MSDARASLPGKRCRDSVGDASTPMTSFEAPEFATAALAMLAMLAGSTVLSTVGFGMGLTVSPILLLAIDPQTVVIMINTVPLVVYVLVITQTRGSLPVREMAPISVAGLMGVPIGVLVLSSAPATTLRVGIVVLILALTAAMAVDVKLSTLRSRSLGLPVGFVVGALVTSSGIGGPLLAMTLLSRGWPAQMLRASLSFYFLLIMASGVVGYAAAGLFTAERLVLILVVMVPALVGFMLASLILRRMNERRFRQSVMAVIAVTSLLVLGREALRIQGSV